MVLEYAAAAGMSGFCAAVAAAAAKVATGDGHQMVQLSPEAAHSETLTVWVRGAFFALHLAANIAMWLLFTRALAAAPSSLEPTAINTAVNIGSSGVLGKVLFGELLGLGWWVGAALIAAGIVLVNHDAARNAAPKDAQHVKTE